MLLIQKWTAVDIVTKRTHTQTHANIGMLRWIPGGHLHAVVKTLEPRSSTVKWQLIKQAAGASTLACPWEMCLRTRSGLHSIKKTQDNHQTVENADTSSASETRETLVDGEVAGHYVRPNQHFVCLP